MAEDSKEKKVEKPGAEPKTVRRVVRRIVRREAPPADPVTELADDVTDELAELGKSVGELTKKVERKTGVPWWLVVLPVGILFAAGVVLPVVQWMKGRRSSRAEAIDSPPPPAPTPA